METRTAHQRHPLGRGNPKRLGSEVIGLYTFPGRVWSPNEFVSAFAAKLEPHERLLVCRHAKTTECVSVPHDIVRCLARSEDPPLLAAPTLIAKRSGGRSACLPERRLKFKGCRPISDRSTYPFEVLRPGATRIEHELIPFGTLSAEGVMRELLGWAFCREHGLPIPLLPICIYEYSADGCTFGYCLVSETRGEERIEAHIEYPPCTIEELVRAKREGLAEIGGVPLGSELPLRDINLWWHAEEKSRLLCVMHFNGGFRGILNSNIGNDVLLRDTLGNPQLCLCDFDSFNILQFSENPGPRPLFDIVLHALIEVVKGSLSILDYVDIPSEATAAEIAEILGRAYFAKSSLWRAYWRRFEREAIARGWRAEAVRDAFEDAYRSEASANVLASCVINSYYLRNLAKDRQIFYPHN